ncbi:ABC transporter ATP-binding protein [Clostridium cochlearium]|uniref:ABC transporter ATP-binding protein n=1 Tax=Clostridium cochlearium TaxID=1494 RepID=A0A239ZIR8_CLOCO|nr:ATP-binding cassette domain-containing protein [Clostridium cochlearium]MBV1821532.1 ATP-binding cassette domain-containing protein [Bacteroidales bacterium MSK.15.36]MBE6063913.1 ATP-binding cassette domain-containing protein [Clostridium cochlearium]MBU5269128.1 ATP-binding cassette domain-containing protein [Clostridium cochlearium]MCG4571122.1 ATP-binding cassette domain-containing protein [Clostridium cochlearium]MCR1971419.1 ATP-binding cassette domain-containing protein [Clostridium 
MLDIQNVGLKVEENGEEITILDNINLNIEEGKIYVITGPNGGGKTTLSKLLMGIRKPSSGKIIFNGENITNLDINERAKLGIGYAFQQPARFKGIKVKELLEIAAKADEKKDLDLCKVLLDVGLCPQDYLNREINNSLSGGELKRIEIATILVRDLKLAVFDEPEAGIDLWSFQKLVETFKNLNREKKLTLVIISHQERIIQLADEVIIISEGKIEKKTSKDEILSKVTFGVECGCNAVCERRN